MFKFQELKAPVDTESGSKGMSIDDMIDSLGAEDNPLEDDDKVLMDSLAEGLKEDKEDGKEDKKDDKESKDEKSDKSDKSDEEDEELTPEDLELASIPRRQEILKAFPELFKKFPSLEKVMYREREYTQIFSTIDDAKEAVETVDQYNKFQDELMHGNIGSVYKALKDADLDSFKTMVDNIIPSLQKVDGDAYLHVVGDVLKRSIISTFNAAKQNNNEDLQQAAKQMWAWIFGNQPAQITSFGKPKSNQEEDVNKEKEELNRERFEASSEDLTRRVGNVLRSTITEHIDPKGIMSPYVKRNAINDVLKYVDDLIDQDTRFAKVKDGLWEKAKESKFSPESMSKIRSAWLGKARSILPDVIRKVRSEALKNESTRKGNNEDKRNRDVVTKVDEPTKKSSNSDKGSIPKGMKTLDFLNSE